MMPNPPPSPYPPPSGRMGNREKYSITLYAITMIARIEITYFFFALLLREQIQTTIVSK